MTALGHQGPVWQSGNVKAKPARPARKAAPSPRLSAAPVQVVVDKATPAPAVPGRPPSQRRGVSGTPAHGGYVTSRETHEALIGANKWKTFANLKLNNSMVAAGLRYYNALIVKPDWKFEPPDDSPEARRIADACQYIIDGMESTWPDVVERASGFAWDGNSVAELVAKRIDGGDFDGMIGLENAYPVPSHTITKWIMGPKGVAGIAQRDPATGKETPIPRRGLLYLVDSAITDSPEGTGMLRHIVEPDARVKRLQQLEGRDFESSIAGMPVISAPLSRMAEEAASGATLADGTPLAEVHAETRAVLEGFIENHLKATDRGLLLESEPWTNNDGTPSSARKMMLEIMRGDASALAPNAAAINRYTHDIARIIGMEILLLGADGVGSLALGQVKADVLALLITSHLGKLTAAVKRDIVCWLGELNGWPKELLPKILIDKIDFLDGAAVGDALRNLAAAGVMFKRSDRLVGEFLRRLGFTWSDEEAQDEEADAAGLRDQGEPDIDEPLPVEDDADVDEPPEPAKKVVRKRGRRR